MLSLEERHKVMIYPVVRIRTSKSGGSGTLIYSKEDPNKSGEYLNFVLTNSHVVFEGAIEHKKDWDSLLEKDIKKEYKSKVDVEIFDYIRLSEVNSSNTHKAEIECYDKKHDLGSHLCSCWESVAACRLGCARSRADLKILAIGHRIS